MSGLFNDGTSRGAKGGTAVRPPSRRSRALLITAAVLVVGFIALSGFSTLWTERLWFGDVGYAAVFSTLLVTRILLFLGFGVVMTLVVGVNIWLAFRMRPLFRPASPEQTSLDRYREAVLPIRRWLLAGVALLMGAFAGTSAAGQWRSFLLWRNGVPFGTADPYFEKDIGFYVFDLPWLHYLVDFAMAVVVVALLAALVVHYLFGGIRLQGTTDRFSGAAQAQLSVLLGLFVLFKAADYWLDRFDLTSNSGGLITGMTYTDNNAVLPSKNILMFIALICALLFFANVVRRTWMLPSVGLALLVLSAILLGMVWPGIVQNFQVDPSQADKEAPYIKRNIEATRAAYNIGDTVTEDYAGKTSLDAEQLATDAASIPGIRLVDPALVQATFEQKQQVRGYYSVADVLDVDRYPINGVERDLVVAVRELDQDGLPEDNKNWANTATAYTHGYGVIAAYGNQRDAENQPITNDGDPIWAEKDIPPQGDLTDLSPGGYQGRIYFGEKSPLYSIVGKSDGGTDVELDLPEGSDGEGGSATSTYEGKAGVPVGSFLNKLLYAVKYNEPNIVLSGRVNENSRILYDRSPLERVEKVAPWLTVDKDPYPAVVDGRVQWILDGYTMTDKYPLSQKGSLTEMTTDAQEQNTQFATLPTDEINYMRNAVKAVVDAYDGTVTLYAWDETDPILQAWMAAFPGTVLPKESIPSELREHMRYPEDLFKVQRYQLAAYHVTDENSFYEGNDRWEVPEDPNTENLLQPPYRLSVRTPSGGEDPVFSLTSVYVPSKKQNLAAFISVDADASEPDYGTLRILTLPGNTQIPGPGQIANQFGADSDIQNKLVAFTRTNSRAVYGNLLTLPVGEGLLYVQPLYALRQSGEGNFPVLRFVLVSFGQDVGIGETLSEAIEDVLGGVGEAPADPVPEPDPGDPGPNQPLPPEVRDLLEQADAKFAEAEAALKAGDPVAYAELVEEAGALVNQALDAAEVPSAKPSGN